MESSESTPKTTGRSCADAASCELLQSTSASSTTWNTSNAAAAAGGGGGGDIIAVGRLVEVASRTWPGINKPGGVARVVEVHFDSDDITQNNDNNNNDDDDGNNDDNHHRRCRNNLNNHDRRSNPSHVNVHYIVGRSKEKRVPVQYVKLAPHYESFQHPNNHTVDTTIATSTSINVTGSSSIIPTSNNSNNKNNNNNKSSLLLRDRSTLLGRCRRCGSLRTDCGSCDWATEELQERGRRQQQQYDRRTIGTTTARTTNTTKRQRRRPITSRDVNRRPSNKTTDDNERGEFSSSSCSSSLSSSSDDEDLLEMQRLIKQTQQQRKKYLKKSRSKDKTRTSSSLYPLAGMLHLGNSTSNKSTAKDRKAKIRTDGRITILDDDDDSSSNSSSSIGDWLEQRKQERYNRYTKSNQSGTYYHQRSRRIKDDNYTSSSSSSSLSSSNEGIDKSRKQPMMHRKRQQRPMSTGVSVLEMLPSADDNITPTLQSTTKTISGTAQKKPNTALSGRRLKRTTIDNTAMPVDNVGERASTTRHRQAIGRGRTTTTAPKLASADEISSSYDPDVQQVNDEELSPIETKNTADSVLDDQLLALEARVRFQMTTQQQQQRMSENLDGVSTTTTIATQHEEDRDENGLHGFIQPEGIDAVENLPSDMIDLSKSLQYHELASFFDSMVNKVEDEILPDCKLQLAMLQREWRTAQTRNIEFLERCRTTWTNISKSLIQNGTDQCRMAIRRLLDDRLYRRVKKQLTDDQRKNCRGPGIMDVRNLRLDALEDTVEEFAQHVKGLVRQWEVTCRENEEEEEEENIQNYDSTIHDDDIMSNNASDGSDSHDFFHDPIVATTKENVIPPTHQLAPYDQHQHASRVRKSRRDRMTIHSNSRRKRTSDKLENDLSGRKRSRSTDNIEVGQLAVSTTKTNVSKTAKKKGRSMHSNHIDTAETVEVAYSEGGGGSSQSSFVEVDGVKSGYSIQEHCNELDMDAAEIRTKSVGSTTEKDGITKHHRNCRYPPRQQKGTIGLRCLQKERSEPSIDFHVGKDRSQSIAARMQDFLNNNIGYGVECNDDVDDEELEEGMSNRNRDYLDHQRRARRQRSGSTAENSIDSGCHYSTQPYQSTLNEHYPSAQVSKTSTISSLGFFEILKMLSNVGREANATTNDNIDKVCGDLDTNYPDSPSLCIDLMSTIESSVAQHSGSADIFLETAHRILTTRGFKTVQEYLATNDSYLKLHMQLLALCVHALKQSSCKDSPAIFAKENVESFLDILVLQLVDTCFSIFFPSAWARNDVECHQFLHDLQPLRNALASRMALTESVCRCVIEKLGCQMWRKSQCNRHAFVSSLDPMEWSTFLRSGIRPSTPERSRYMELGKVWPRIETETLWKLLAFTSAGNNQEEGRSFHRWQIISKIFSNGVLASSIDDDDNHAKLPPSTTQLLACSQEISYLVSIISTGALDPIPKTDSVFANLVERALKLQADSYAGDESARAACCYISSDLTNEKKITSKLWRMTDPFHVDELVIEMSAPICFDIPIDNENEAHYTHLAGILRPTSKILLRCLALCVNWIGHVPRKKIRQGRLAKSLESLQQSLLLAANAAFTTNCNNTEATFESAFATSPSQIVGISSERVCVFYKEAAAHLRLVGYLAQGQGTLGTESNLAEKPRLDPNISREIWNIIADDVMMASQAKILNSCTKQKPRYVGDLYRLLSAVKVMATILMVHLNVSPWAVNVENKIVQLFQNDFSIPTESLSFAVSCIFACLDCLCDLERGCDFLGQVYEIIIWSFHTLTQVSKHDGESPALEHLRCFCLPNLTAVFTRCLNVHLNHSGNSSVIDSHFRLFFASLRAAQLHAATASRVHAAQETENVAPSVNRMDETDAGYMDDMDDSFFAAIEIACPINEATMTKDTRNQHVILIELLSDLLEHSKPSKRFAIVAPALNSTSMLPSLISPAGRHLLSKEMDRVCDCFLSALAADSEGYSELARLVSKWIQPTYYDDEDADFCARASKRLARGLCALSERFPSFEALVCENADRLLFTFLGSLTSSSRLESFPSRNLERIRLNAGEKGMEQSIALLDLFNDDDLNIDSDDVRLGRLQRKRKRKATEIWDFCHQLGLMYSRINCGPNFFTINALGGVLLNIDSDPISDISLEDETIKLFRLLRNVISSAASESHDFAVFEGVSSYLLFSIGNQTLQVLQSLKYHDQTSCRTSPDYEKDLKHSRLNELLFAFVELLVATITWIIRENPLQTSESWSSIQRNLRDHFLSPILRRQVINISIPLQELVVSTGRFLSHPMSSRTSLALGGGGTSAVLVDCEKYLSCDSIFIALVRRSRQLMIATTRNNKFICIQHALLEATLSSDEVVGGDKYNNVAFIVGTAFPSTRTTIIVQNNRTYHSPLELAIDEYLSSVEDERLLVSSDDHSLLDSMIQMKKDFLTNLIIPGLNRISVSLPKRRQLLLLLKYSLEYDTASTSVQNHHPASHELSSTLLDMGMACSIIKALSFNIYRCLEQTSVDSTIVAAIFDTSLFMIRATIRTIMDCSSEQVMTTLIAWSYKNVQRINDKKSMIDLSKSEIDACYIWIYIQWLYCIASRVLVVSPNTTVDDSDDDMTKLRLEWREYRGCRIGSMNDETLTLVCADPTATILGLDYWDRLLADFERLLFSINIGTNGFGTNTTSVKNVYAKNNQYPSSSLLLSNMSSTTGGVGCSVEPWIPSSAVRRSAKEYMAFVVSIT